MWQSTPLRSEVFLGFGFYFSLSHSDLLGNKFSYFPQVESVSPMKIIGE